MTRVMGSNLTRAAVGGTLIAFSLGVLAASPVASDDDIKQQRAALAEATEGAGFGPQSPRDIDQLQGSNQRIFQPAPHYRQMNLCNIHFHAGAEHRGGEFTTYAGNGDGKGFGTGFLYDGKLEKHEAKPFGAEVCATKGNGLDVGDTIELHYVHTTAAIEPGPTLGACLSESIGNPQLRVEAQVYVLVNDRRAADFASLTQLSNASGYWQATNIPADTGAPVQYAGSTTGPSYNEEGSPLQVSWSVRPKVKKVDIETVATWCEDNVFDEDHAHGVRNLVVNPDLISEISPWD